MQTTGYPERRRLAPVGDGFVLLAFLLVALGGGLAIGFLTLPGAWYAGLAKPPFNPPNWLFGPVWTALYAMIGVAGWRVWRSGERRLQRLWWAQLVLNFLWSPMFFAAHQLALALIVILAMLGVIIAFTWIGLKHDRIAGWFFVPYAGWVAFATLLNASLLVLNF